MSDLYGHNGGADISAFLSPFLGFLIKEAETAEVIAGGFMFSLPLS